MKGITNLLVLVVIGFGLYGLFKPLPPGVNEEYPGYSVSASGIHFYEDLTYVNSEDERFSNQEIFDQVFSMIDAARHYILLDMFLFNDFLGTETESYRSLSQELTDKLVDKKEKNPDLPIVFITDPINDIYGGLPSKHLAQMREAGIVVVVTDLKQLRDSNPLYSSIYRTFFQWFENQPDVEGSIDNPFDSRAAKLDYHTFIELLNFKANHRKVVIVDGVVHGKQKMRVLVTSANPHDGSSAHTNTALVIDDFVWKDALETERVVALFSGITIPEPSPDFLKTVVDDKGDVTAGLITEAKIKEKIIRDLRLMGEEDRLDMAMFYLSDRQVIRELKRADERGAKIRLLLDPNKDAFGREKNGIPNRSVAHELLTDTENLEIRWCDTHGEQCHTKMLLISDEHIKKLMLGSANLTRRNIGGFNLETNVYIESSGMVPAISQAHTYFEKVWNNQGGRIYSTDYELYGEDVLVTRIQYRFMEDLGISSF